MERILSGLGSIMRPIAKELIKGGIVVADAVSELVAETGEQFKDLLAEAKAEMEKPESREQETNETEREESRPKGRSARAKRSRVKE